MNKIAFIFSGYSRNLIFSNDSVTNYDVYKGNVLNTLKHIGSNVECINLMLKSLERVKNIEQCIVLKTIKVNYSI